MCGPFGLNGILTGKHRHPSLLLYFVSQYNAIHDVAVSADEAGMVEYWSGIKHDLQFPKNVDFEYKTDTDLFEFIMVRNILILVNIQCPKFVPS